VIFSSSNCFKEKGYATMSNPEFLSLLTSLSNGEPAYFRRMIDGATYTRKFSPAERLIILGGGHIAQPLCRIAAMLNFSVFVVDDRPSFANTPRFPEAEKVICDGFPSAIKDLGIRPSDYVCVLTRGHRYDADCLRRILPGRLPSYLGMIGSVRRVSGLMELLRDEGYDSGKLAQIHAPIGLKINALTPAEIAVSICAELVAHRRRSPEKEEVLPQTDADMSVLQFLAEGEGPKAMLLVLNTKGSTPVEAGAIMAIDPFGRTYGTIGGGCSENAVILQARQLIGSGRAEVAEVDMTNDVAAEEAMVCGGTMQVLVEDIPEEEASDASFHTDSLTERNLEL
jgi:xanthine dehydrogenase accessory factor